MEILEGRELNEAVARALGWEEVGPNEYGHSRGRPPGKRRKQSIPLYTGDRLTWAVVEKLRAKGWRYELIDGAETEMSLTLSTHDNFLWADAEHAHRNTAILNACLRAMNNHVSVLGKIVRLYIPNSIHNGKLATILDEYDGGYLVRVNGNRIPPLWVSHENVGSCWACPHVEVAGEGLTHWYACGGKIVPDTGVPEWCPK